MTKEKKLEEIVGEPWTDSLMQELRELFDIVIAINQDVPMMSSDYREDRVLIVTEDGVVKSTQIG
jgi:GTP:adenosylcobinamide-phosphate guanylyltransferase